MPMPEASSQTGQDYVHQAVSAADSVQVARSAWNNLYESDKHHYRELARAELMKYYDDPPESQIEARAKHLFEGNK